MPDSDQIDSIWVQQIALVRFLLPYDPDKPLIFVYRNGLPATLMSTVEQKNLNRFILSGERHFTTNFSIMITIKRKLLKGLMFFFLSLSDRFRLSKIIC